MRKKVKIKKDSLGNAIRQSKNPKYGYVVVKQKRLTIGTNGWVNSRKFTAIIKGEVDDLKEMGFDTAKSLDGNIVVRESTTPFNMSNPEADLKVAGDTGVILCTENGEPIYRITIYDPTGSLKDVIIPHYNGDEIREALNNIDSNESKNDVIDAEEGELEDDNQLNIFEDNEEDVDIDNDVLEDDTVFSLEG